MTQAYALALTVLIEGVVATVALRVWTGRRGRELGVGVAIVVAASCLTHPFAWTANKVWLRDLSFPARAVIIESAVVVVEAAILERASGWGSAQRIAWWRALAISLLANGMSFAYGWVRA